MSNKSGMVISPARQAAILDELFTQSFNEPVWLAPRKEWDAYRAKIDAAEKTYPLLEFPEVAGTPTYTRRIKLLFWRLATKIPFVYHYRRERLRARLSAVATMYCLVNSLPDDAEIV